jgi:hypothetical protein
MFIKKERFQRIMDERERDWFDIFQEQKKLNLVWKCSFWKRNECQ